MAVVAMMTMALPGSLSGGQGRARAGHKQRLLAFKDCSKNWGQLRRSCC
jgi:hypothetical protein